MAIESFLEVGDVSQNSRQTWIDVAKGILILLVVVGHAVGTGFHLPGPSWACNLFQGIYKVIYTFHMPAFFVLAGVTWSVGKTGFGGYVRKKAFRLLVPYYIFGFLSVLLGCVVGGVAASSDGYYGGAANSNARVFINFLLGGACPLNSPLWFLPCMFMVEVLYYPLGRWIKFHAVGNVIPVILFVIGYFVSLLGLHGMPGRMDLVPLYMGFLAFGHLFVPRTGVGKIAALPRWRDFGLVVGVALYGVLGYYIPWLWDTPLHYVLHVLLAIAGAVLVFGLAQRINIRFLVECGASSIGILVLHKFVIAALLLKTPLQQLIDSGVWVASSNILVIGASVAVSLIGVWVVRHTAPWMLGERTQTKLVK